MKWVRRTLGGARLIVALTGAAVGVTREVVRKAADGWQRDTYGR